MKYFFNLAYLRKKWPNLVLDNWKVVTNFLVKAVTQVLLFSGVTAFNSLSADFRSMLVRVLPLHVTITFKWVANVSNQMHGNGSICSVVPGTIGVLLDNKLRTRFHKKKPVLKNFLVKYVFVDVIILETKFLEIIN